MKKKLILLACLLCNIQLYGDACHMLIGSLGTLAVSLAWQKVSQKKAHSLKQEELNEALFEAIREENVILLRLALRAGANPNAQSLGSSSNISALQKVATRGRVDLLRELIVHGVNIHARDKWGITATQRAADMGQVEAVRVLVDAGAPKEYLERAIKQVPNKELREAIIFDNVHQLVQAIADGADVNARCEYGFHPIMSVVIAHHKTIALKSEFIKILVESGSDINARGEILEETALCAAAGSGDKEMCDVLIYYGADITITDKYGNTPSDKAQANGFSELAEYLRSKAVASDGLKNVNGEDVLDQNELAATKI